MIFAPTSAITKFKCFADANNTANKVLSLPETLDTLPPCNIDLTVSNKLADDSVDLVLPKLSMFELNRLSLNLNYSTDELFSIMMKYLVQAPERHLKELSLHIYSQVQFEECLRTIANMSDSIQKLSLVLYCEALLDVRNLIHALKKAKPFVNVELHYAYEREETFTVKDMLKKLKAKLML